MASSVWTRFSTASAGVLGLCGVATGAAGAHGGGGGLAALASTFFIVHAAALLGLSIQSERFGSGERLCRLAAVVLGLGTILFAGDVATVGLTGVHLLRGLAPTGGTLLLIGWILVIAAPIRDSFGRST